MPRPTHFRQEVLNVLLAQLLQERGAVSAPEEINTVGANAQRRIPDVIVTFRGLRTAIEGEIGHTTTSESKALKSARKRVEENIAHVGVAVTYSQELAEAQFGDLKTNLARSSMRIAVVAESGSTEFVEGDVDYLERMLRTTFDQLVQEDVVNRAVAMLDGSIERFAAVMVVNSGNLGRVADALGITELPASERRSRED